MAINLEKDCPDVYGPNGSDYSNNDPRYDFSLIKIDVTEKHKDAGICTPGEWATIHWVGSLVDGRVVTDSKQEHDGLPLTFALGASEV